MKIIDPKTLFERKDLPWFELLQIDIERAEFQKWLNSEPIVDWVNGLGDADYWAVEFDCGLLLFFEFIHSYPDGSVFSTEPNVNHVIRHLAHWRREVSEIPRELTKLDFEWTLSRFSESIPQLRQQHCSQLWRQGDDGNPIAIGYSTSVMDATCHMRELESRGHKQLYWIESLEERELK